MIEEDEDGIAVLEEDEILECPLCEADQPASAAALGRLGNLMHYRCRYCGGQWSVKQDAEG